VEYITRRIFTRRRLLPILFHLANALSLEPSDADIVPLAILSDNRWSNQAFVLAELASLHWCAAVMLLHGKEQASAPVKSGIFISRS
jgi:hypothetical protein